MTESLEEMAAAAAPAAPAAAPTGKVAVSDMLLGSLGLNDVESDPNYVPPGTYDAVVYSSDLVHVKSKNTVSHVITYKITDGDYKDKRQSKFHELGVNPDLDENGKVIAFTPTQTATNKQWHKKNFVDLGVPEAQVASTPISALVGRECTITLTKNGAFTNIAGVGTRGNTVPQSVPTAAVVAGEATPEGTEDEPPF